VVQWVPCLIPLRQEYLRGTWQVPLGNENVQVTKLPEREVAIGRDRQRRPFERNGGDVVFLQVMQHFEQFSCQGEVAGGGLVKVGPKPLQDVRRYGIRTRLVEVPIKEGHDPMLKGHSGDIRPIEGFLQEGLELDVLSIQTRTSAVQQEIDFTRLLV